MFDRPGEKIKAFAKVFAAILLVGGFIAALVVAIESEDFAFFFLIFLSAALTGVLTGLFFYGFGTLIESTEANERNTREILAILNNGAGQRPQAAPAAAQPVRAQAPAQTPAAPAPVPTGGGAVRLANGRWRCVCGTENADYVSSCSCGRRKRDVLK